MARYNVAMAKKQTQKRNATRSASGQEGSAEDAWTGGTSSARCDESKASRRYHIR